MDGSLSCPSVGLHFGYQEPDRTIQDIFNSRKYGINDIIYEHKSGVHLIAASHIKKTKSLNGFKQRIRSLRSYYDFIILDSSPIIGEEMDTVINSSDFTFAITTPDHASLASTMYAIKKAKENNINVSGIILNKVLSVCPHSFIYFNIFILFTISFFFSVFILMRGRRKFLNRNFLS